MANNEAKREYMKAWREKNRKAVNEYAKRWRDNHPERVREYQEKYWTKKALEQMAKEMNSEQGADYAQRA